MADRVKQVAAEESKKVKEMTTDAIKSRTYLYPLKVCLCSKCTVCGVEPGSNFDREFSISFPTKTCGSP